MTPAGSAASPPSIQFDRFDGPLDLLLDEVRRQNVEIERISLAPMVARFLEYMRAAAARNLDLNIEWLHMASTLILWKSRALLPSDAAGDPPADAIRDELVRQLLAHKKAAAEELGRLRSAQAARFRRGVETGFEESPAAEDDPVSPSFVSVWDMIQEAREMARWVRGRREDLRYARETLGVEPDDVTVDEMGQYLRTQVAAAPGFGLDGLRLLEDQPSVSRRCCLFLALLEMVRDRQIEVIQNETFGPFSVARCEGS
jgi:segregation and condensation protein A